MKYRTAIIGCGWIGCGISNNTTDIKSDTHMKAYLDCPNTELVALCDNKRFVPFTEIRQYDDYMKMVDCETPDIVSVCTPPETHCEIVCNIAPFVKAIYCEKPMATNLKECDEMIRVCHTHGAILQINHERRFMTPIFTFSRGIIDSGTHVFDLIRHLFGEVATVTKDYVITEHGLRININYVDTSGFPWKESHIGGFECMHSDKPMILKGVEHLVDCLNNHHESVSSGEDGREALRLTLEYKRLRETT